VGLNFIGGDSWPSNPHRRLFLDPATSQSISDDRDDDDDDRRER
jgi:hypothetical protein